MENRINFELERTKINTSLVPCQLRKMAPDLVLLGILAAAVSILVLVAFRHVSPFVFHYSTWDFWFESDPPAVADQMLNRLGRNHLRTSHHPLFSILVFAPVYALRKTLQLSSELSIGVVLAVVAAMWISSVFICLRALRLRRSDSVIFSALAATSASAIFWFPIPESFEFGALSIILAITLTALSERNFPLPLGSYFIASVLTLSFTLTNWMIGLAMLFVILSWRKALMIAVASFGAVIVVSIVQKAIFPTAGSFFNNFTTAETTYIFNEEALGLLAKLYAFFFHSIVMPEVGDAYGFRLSVQKMLPGAGSYLATAAVGIWTALLVMAGWSVSRLKGSKTTSVLLLSICGQLVLTLVFGIETFMYSAHFGPILVLFCALSGLTKARRFAVPLGIVLVILAGANNIQKFAVAADRLKERYEDEYQFTAKIAELTGPDALIVCGREAAAATGEDGHARLDPRKTPVELITLDGDPDTCSFMFNDLQVSRKGWILLYEDWSIDAIETLRQRGARYFITAYAFGLKNGSELFETLDKRFQKLERTSKMAFYDLSR